MSERHWGRRSTAQEGLRVCVQTKVTKVSETTPTHVLRRNKALNLSSCLSYTIPLI